MTASALIANVSRVQSLLVIKTSSLGDVVHTLSALLEALGHNPNMAVDWVCEESFADVAALFPQAIHVIPVAQRRWRKTWYRPATWREIFAFVRRLQSKDYDCVIDAQGLAKSAWITKLARAKEKVGFDARSAKEPISAKAMTRTVYCPVSDHAIQRLRGLFGFALGYEPSGAVRSMGLGHGRSSLRPDQVNEQGNEQGNDQTRERNPGDLGDQGRAPPVLFLHGTTRREKTWPTENWIAMGQKLVAQGFCIEIPWGSHAEYLQASAIAQAIGPKAQCLPKQSIAQLADRMMGSRAVVGVDSGLTHLSVWLGRPTVAVMSAAHLKRFASERFAPFWAPHARVVSSQSASDMVSAELVMQAFESLGQPQLGTKLGTQFDAQASLQSDQQPQNHQSQNQQPSLQTVGPTAPPTPAAHQGRKRYSESISQRAARWIYTIAVIAMLPLLLAYLVWRGIAQRDYFKNWSERFIGVPLSADRDLREKFFSQRSHPKSVNLWVHAVSVGETRAAAPLIERWLEQSEHHLVTLTHVTPTGRETGLALFERYMRGERGMPRLVSQYLPYDFPWASRLFLRRYRPTLGVLMETELWPNVLNNADRNKIPVALINARLSARSARRLHQFSWLAQPALARLCGIAAQTREDADRLMRASESKPNWAEGSNITVTGNLKFDVSYSQDQIDLGLSWRTHWPHRSVWLAASTREDEEDALFAAWKRALAAGSLRDALLVVVPRHPQRFDRVYRLAQAHQLNVLRRSESTELGKETQVWIGDSLGEMFAYIQASDLVLIGGSLIPLGGQNPIEPCALGRPVFFGPHMFNFKTIATTLLREKAGVQIQSIDEWISRGQALLADQKAYEEMSLLAAQFARSHRGATEKTLGFLKTILQKGY